MILILGDPHFGKGVRIGKVSLGEHLNSRLKDQLDLFKFTLKKAIKHKVSDIIITGDIFDSDNPNAYLINLLLLWIKECKRNNIAIHMVTGNHDIVRKGDNVISTLDLFNNTNYDNLYVYNDIETIKINDIAITLFPFKDRKSLLSETTKDAIDVLQKMLELEKPNLVNKNILIGHLAIVGSLYVGDEFDDIQNEIFCPINMFESYDITIMGHIHKPQIMSKNPYVEIIGSMDISDFGEGDQIKSLILIDDNLSIKKIKLPTRKLIQKKIIISKDVVDVTAFVLDYLSPLDLKDCILSLFIEIHTKNQESINKKEIESFLYSKNVFHISNISEIRKVEYETSSEIDIENKADIIYCIDKYKDKVPDKLKDLFVSICLNINKSVSKE